MGFGHLEQSEGRHNGARYYILKPEGYTPNWDNQTWNEMVEWCVERFGPTGSVWEPGVHRWYVNNAKFWFREPDDLLMFLLRWQ